MGSHALALSGKDGSLVLGHMHIVWVENFYGKLASLESRLEQAREFHETAFRNRVLNITVPAILYLTPILIIKYGVLEDKVVEPRLCNRSYDPFLDLSLVVDEGKVAETPEGSLLDKFLTGATTYAKGVHALAHAALRADQVDNLLSVPYRSIS